MEITGLIRLEDIFDKLHWKPSKEEQEVIEVLEKINNYKPGGKMKLDIEDNKFVTYLIIGMMVLGFVVMLLV